MTSPMLRACFSSLVKKCLPCAIYLFGFFVIFSLYCLRYRAKTIQGANNNSNVQDSNDHQAAAASADSRSVPQSSDITNDKSSRESAFRHSPIYPPRAHSPIYSPSSTYKPSYTGTSNPFAKTDEDTSNMPNSNEGLIAPSRFTSTNSNSHFRTYNDYVNEARAAASLAASSSFSFRPSILSHNHASRNNESGLVTSSGASLLKPARLRAPHSPSAEPTALRTTTAESQPDSVTSSTEATPAPSLHPSSTEDSVTTTNGSVNSSSCDHVPTNENYFTSTDSTPGPVSTVGVSFVVFGQNLGDRVTGVSSTTCTTPTPQTNGSDSPTQAEAASTEYVFGQNLSPTVSGAAGFTAEVDDTGGDSDKEKGGCTLVESARDYQAKHDNRTNLEEIEVMTGEENEANVLQCNCKLFIHDKTAQNWTERGQGVLRLNDMAATDHMAFQSRLVMRTHGSFKLILNSKIWTSMMLERASPRSIRFSGMDTDDTIKVFLIMLNAKDSESVMSAVEWRIQKLNDIEESQSQGSGGGERVAEKRAHEVEKEDSPKRFKSERDTTPHQDRPIPPTEESTDSSVPDPETEASSGSRSSSALGLLESD